MSRDELVRAIGEVARRLPSGQVAALAKALEGCHAPTAEAKSKAVTAVANPAFANLARKVTQAWEGEDGVDGSCIAAALTAAASAVEDERRQESIGVVWTGPRTTAVPVRLTRAVLLEVIRAARESLFVVSFAAYRIDAVLEELARAVDREVTVRLILETGEASGGTLTLDAAEAFKSMRAEVSFYIWPTEKRPVLERGRASLHAKAAIADDHTAFVTSANLTGHGIGENMELGLLVKGGPVPRRLSEHFRELIAEGVLSEVLR